MYPTKKKKKTVHAYSQMSMSVTLFAERYFADVTQHHETVR